MVKCCHEKINNTKGEKNMLENILTIENLTKSYKEVVAVKNLSLSLKEGEVFGFIGPNGAGKSTTIRSIMNLVNKDTGKILFYDKELTKDVFISVSRLAKEKFDSNYKVKVIATPIID